MTTSPTPEQRARAQAIANAEKRGAEAMRDRCLTAARNAATVAEGDGDYGTGWSNGCWAVMENIKHIELPLPSAPVTQTARPSDTERRA